MFTLNFIGTIFILLNFIDFCHCLCDQRKFGGELKCCPGKDSKCYAKIFDKESRRETNQICYCDSYCKFTNDCCQDYAHAQRYCKGVIDCEVYQWSIWSGCSTQCGFGTMDRYREVKTSAKNGGRQCPPLKQTRGCNLNKLCDERYVDAFILPIEYRRPIFGKWGYENILPAIKLEKSHAIQNRVAPEYSYCVHFKFVSKRTECRGTWADRLISSVPICVECQSRVMDGTHCKGEGEVSLRSRWNALGIDRCYGDWIRIGPSIPNCSCDENEFTNFVFV